jgi:hypothetical protein
MSKSFTCRELMGICDEKFSGDTLMEIVQKGMTHMQSDEAHKKHIESLGEQQTKEDQKKWFEDMQQVFDARSDDK